jgi:hypothetical protein
VADGWCWFVLREKYCWLVADGWFVVREKYCWPVADKPNEQGVYCCFTTSRLPSLSRLPRVVAVQATQVSSFFLPSSSEAGTSQIDL